LDCGTVDGHHAFYKRIAPQIGTQRGGQPIQNLGPISWPPICGDSSAIATFPTADLTIKRIGDLLNHDFPALFGAKECR
jgi:hypothetical protein